jgi:NMT1/THI5 like
MRVRFVRSRFAVTVAVLALGLVVVGCGSSSSKSSSSSAGGSSASAAGGSSGAEPSISVGLPVPVTDYSIILVAQAEGYFKKFGVKVDIQQNIGSDALTDLASGEVDLLTYATSAATSLIQKGQAVTAVYGFEKDPGSALVTEKSIKTLAQLKATSGCRLAVGAQGSQGYGYAVLYNKKFGLNCQLDQTPSAGVQIARVASGADQGMVTNYTEALLAQHSNGANIIINPLLPGYRAKYSLPPQYLTGTIFGLSKNVKAKGPAIVKFLEALNAAAKIQVVSNSPRIAKDDSEFSMFNGTPASVLLQQVKTTLPFNGASANPNTPPPGASATVKAQAQYQPGWVTPAVWQAGLNQFTTYGLTDYNPKNPLFAYDKVVDMSYLKQALAGQ